MEYANWKEKFYTDETTEKIDFHEYCPNSTNLNQPHSDIRIIIQNQDQFILPHESYLYIECKLEKEDGTSYDNRNDEISVVNNALTYLFERISYELGGKEVEGYSNVGVATTMKGLLTYPENYAEGTQFLWKKDNSSDVKGTHAKARKNMIFQQNNTGNFTGIIPLTHLFGFCENYRKVIYGLQHTLILRRNYNADAILKSSERDANNIEKVADGKLNILKLSWYMPHVTLSDETKLILMKDINNRVSLNIGFLNRQCERYNLTKGNRELDWRLNIAANSERPRYIIVGFQKMNNQNQSFNTAIFEHFNFKNAFIQLNNERYPEHDLKVDFKLNNFIHAYKMVTDFYRNVIGKEQIDIGLIEFKRFYPLLVFDISRQSEKLKSTPVDIRIKASFDNVLDEDVVAYALVLSDRFIRLQSDGNKMNIVY